MVRKGMVGGNMHLILTAPHLRVEQNLRNEDGRVILTIRGDSTVSLCKVIVDIKAGLVTIVDALDSYGPLDLGRKRE